MNNLDRLFPVFASIVFGCLVSLTIINIQKRNALEKRIEILEENQRTLVSVINKL